MKIRKATQKDKDHIAKIWRMHPAKFIGGVYMAALNRDIDNGECHVAEINSVVVGFVRFHTRRDNWTTIYTIAVNPNHKGQYIGRHLLWSVPAPFRLKVTTDNTQAIRFYEHVHMVRAGYEETKKGDGLYVYEFHVLFIHVQGGNPKHAEICQSIGIPYGTRNTDKAYGTVFMLDVNWEQFKKGKFSWNNYLETVTQLNPIQVMTVDYESPSEYDSLMGQIQDLRDLGTLRIMVCPKFNGAIADIPHDCIVGVSVPSKHAGFLPDPSQLSGRRVHLLGGSPPKQRHYTMVYRGHGAIVQSVDGNSHEAASSKGSVWINGRWQRPPKGREKLDKFHAQTMSARNIVAMFQSMGQTKQLKLL